MIRSSFNPGENRHKLERLLVTRGWCFREKVGNIVRKQAPQFKELHHRLVTGLPGVHCLHGSEEIEQDVGDARLAHLRKLPSRLLTGVRNNYSIGCFCFPEADENMYWVRIAGMKFF
jgi:translocator assembly and maintenance protein 41